MQKKVIITCAITGNITTPEQHPRLPITPQEIAESALEAAKAGASVAHIHVRDPKTGRPSMNVDYYREVMDRIRDQNPALIINLTTGPGGRFVPSHDDPKIAGPGTTLMAPELRVEHIAELKPEICTLDLNTMNSGGQVVINTPANVIRMARIIRAAGVKPEIEIFDSGDLRLAHDLIKQGDLEGPGLFSLVLGVNYGFGADPETMLYARSLLPENAMWSGFGIGRHEFPMVAQAFLYGGNVRVGFEDNLYLSKGVLADSNAQLVQRARQIIESMGGEIATANEARDILGLPAAVRFPHTNRVTSTMSSKETNMSAIRVHEKAASIDELQLGPATVGTPIAGPGQCVIQVHSAGVNPSDVKATLGAMPHAVWPRTPGRDYAGVVVDGPQGLVGKEVWGSGGELGIRRDGTHAQYLLVDAASVREKPNAISMLEASAVGVPFITAYEGLRRVGMPRQGDVVLVFGANGKVGQAAIQLATRAQATVFAVERDSEPFKGHASSPIDLIDASAQPDIADYIRAKTNGHGADIVYNTVGSPYFEQACLAMAIGGRQIFISTIERAVPFDIFAFYRGQHTFAGIDTLAMDSRHGARILDELAPGFENGSLKPFPVKEENIYALADAATAYRSVMAGAIERIVVRP